MGENHYRKNDYSEIDNIKKWLIENKDRLDIPNIDGTIVLIDSFQTVYKDLEYKYKRRNLIDNLETFITMNKIIYGNLCSLNQDYIFDYDFISEYGDSLCDVLMLPKGVYWTNATEDNHNFACWNSNTNTFVLVPYEDNAYYFKRN